MNQVTSEAHLHRLTEPMLRTEVWWRLFDAFKAPLDQVQTAQISLHVEEDNGIGSLRVRWRGKGVLRLFELAKLSGSMEEFSADVVTTIIDSLRRQFEIPPANEER